MTRTEKKALLASQVDEAAAAARAFAHEADDETEKALFSAATAYAAAKRLHDAVMAGRMI